MMGIFPLNKTGSDDKNTARVNQLLQSTEPNLQAEQPAEASYGEEPDVDVSDIRQLLGT
jgi:hypothetical protein